MLKSRVSVLTILPKRGSPAKCRRTDIFVGSASGKRMYQRPVEQCIIRKLAVQINGLFTLGSFIVLRGEEDVFDIANDLFPILLTDKLHSRNVHKDGEPLRIIAVDIFLSAAFSIAVLPRSNSSGYPTSNDPFAQVGLRRICNIAFRFAGFCSFGFSSFRFGSFRFGSFLASRTILYT